VESLWDLIVDIDSVTGKLTTVVIVGIGVVVGAFAGAWWRSIGGSTAARRGWRSTAGPRRGLRLSSDEVRRTRIFTATIIRVPVPEGRHGG
jgi:hypothetical protein